MMDSDYGRLYIFRTNDRQISGGFRYGFTSFDEHAFTFSLIRPDLGGRGIAEQRRLLGNPVAFFGTDDHELQ